MDAVDLGRSDVCGDVVELGRSEVFWDVVDLELREKFDPEPTHVINIDIQDNHEEATIGAFMICDLCTLVRAELLLITKSFFLYPHFLTVWLLSLVLLAFPEVKHVVQMVLHLVCCHLYI